MQQGTFDRQQVTVCNTRAKMRIATWNVRTMQQAGKLDNIKLEATRLELDIVGLGEVRWKDSGTITSDDYMLIYSGNKSEHKHGVGLLLNKRVSKSVMGYYALSDRILLVKLFSKPFNVSIIQLYAPTSACSDDDIEQFYDDLNKAYKHCGSQDVIVVMGDLNAKVGNEQDPMKEIVGPHGLGERNERGDMWVDWCVAHNQVIMNTWFQHHVRRLYTWKSPGDGIRNQIDYITINKRFRNSIQQVKGYPGADCGSDHVLLVSLLKLNLKILPKKKSLPKLELELLRKDEELKNKYMQCISKRMNDLDTVNNLEDRYTSFVSALSESAKSILPKVERKGKQKWMTNDILMKMDARRNLKSKPLLYDALDKEIRRDCQEAKEQMLTEQCERIEQLDAANRTNLMHEEIRKVTGRKQGLGATTCIEAKDGTIIMEQERVLTRWYEYINELYHDNRGDIPTIDMENDGTPITYQEVEYALKGMPMRKAPGPDDIATEMLVAAGDVGLQEMTKLTNMMYRDGCFPKDMNKSIFITIPKVRGTVKCEKHRTISLMSHITKLVLRVIMNRLKGRTIQEIAPEQYGFMPDKGTRNAIFVLRRIAERSIEKQKDVYLCFIDYSKAFDTVKHEHLIQLLQSLDIDAHEIRLLTNLYWNQEAAVRHNGEVSNWMSIKQGVRQGCVASPYLFALYTEMIMRRIDGMDGLKIGGKVINNLRYADDTVIIAESAQQLQQLIDVVVEESENKGLYLNSAKSFTMVFSKSPVIPKCNITVHGKSLEQVSKFVYLGSLFTADGRCEKEVRRRIGIAKSAYRSMEKVLKSRSIDIKVRVRTMKCYVWSTLMYGCETWTLSDAMIKLLESAEVWFLRRMLRIAWTDKITNVEVFQRAKVRKELMKDIVRRQMSFLGHTLRKDELENLVVTGYIEGKRARGRQRETYLTYLNKMKKRTPTELIHMARDRTVWSKLCK